MKTATRKDDCKAPPELLLNGLIESDEPEEVITDERLRVGIFPTTDRCDDCNQNLHWLEIEFLDPDGSWRPVLGLHEANFPTVLSVFRQVDAHLKLRAD
jgi:hypothetical protein